MAHPAAGPVSSSACRRRPGEGSASLAPAPQLLFSASELPGRYYLGDGLGVNCRLSLEVNGRFSFCWTGCLGEYDRNEGSWTLEGDRLLMKPEKPNRREGFEGMNLRFMPVKWHDRVLLIDENEMPGFCASARGRTVSNEEYAQGTDYVRVDKVLASVRPGGVKPLIPSGTMSSTSTVRSRRQWLR